jgi:hypothetical protein
MSLKFFEAEEMNKSFVSRILIIFLSLTTLMCNAIATETTAPPQLGNRLVFNFNKNKRIDLITQITPVSYTYQKTNGQLIESIYGVIDIDITAGQILTDHERSKILKLGDGTEKSIKFQYSGNSGSGNWTRTVIINGTNSGKSSFKGSDYETITLKGEVNAPGWYHMEFECEYAIKLGTCLTNSKKTYSKRNPQINGVVHITLVEIQR